MASAGTGKQQVVPAVPAPEQPKVNWLDLAFKVLSMAVLPLLAVGISMWSEQALFRERITNIQREQTEVRSQLDVINTRINQIALTVQETNGKIGELRTVLDFIRTQVSNQAMPPQRTGGQR
jgi:TolA-binding protein